MIRRLIAIMLIIGTTSLLITGCPQSSETDSTSPPSSNGAPSSNEQPPIGTEVGNLAPNFQLQDLDGNTVSLSDLRGSPVMLNFWATWCGPCRAEMPHFQAVYEEYSAEGLVLLAINIGESQAEVASFKQSNNLSFTILLDSEAVVTLKYEVGPIPTTFFIDKDGIIREIRIGSFSSKQDIENSLSKIMP